MMFFRWLLGESVLLGVIVLCIVLSIHFEDSSKERDLANAVCWVVGFTSACAAAVLFVMGVIAFVFEGGHH